MQDARWPSLAELWEVAGLWLLVVLAAILLMGGLALRMEGQAIAETQRERVALTLAELKETLEADLALGLDLPEDRRAQTLIEQALERDRQLRAVDVLDRQGLTLFSTDRGAIGEATFSEVAAAAAGTRGDATWSAEVAGEVVIGLPLRGPFGETVGHVGASYAPVDSGTGPDAQAGRRRIVLATLLLLLGAGVIALPCALWARRPQQRSLKAQRHGAMAQADARVATIRQRLDTCLAQLDESERPP